MMIQRGGERRRRFGSSHHMGLFVAYEGVATLHGTSHFEETFLPLPIALLEEVTLLGRHLSLKELAQTLTENGVAGRLFGK